MRGHGTLLVGPPEAAFFRLHPLVAALRRVPFKQSFRSSKQGGTSFSFLLDWTQLIVGGCCVGHILFLYACTCSVLHIQWQSLAQSHSDA